jgi:hypothetical protein
MKRMLTLLLSFGTLFIVATSCGTKISPREMTVTAIGASFARIHLYAKTNGELPQTIGDFPQRDGYANRTQDGWGHELIYDISDTGVITLTSLGADQKPGGTDDNADISRSYRSTDEDGRFIAGEDMWLVKNELRETD